MNENNTSHFVIVSGNFTNKDSKNLESNCQIIPSSWDFLISFSNTLKSDNSGTAFRIILELIRLWCGAKGRKSGKVNNLESLSAVRKKGAVPLHRLGFKCIEIIRYEISEQKKRKFIIHRKV